MSKRIAPGQWDDELRTQAQKRTRWAGYALMFAGSMISGAMVLLVIMYEREVDMWLFALGVGPLLLGVFMSAPDIFTPLAYRLLERKKGGES